MTTPDLPAFNADEEAAGFDAEPDDVEGHRMLRPEQAQQRSDAARIERERKLRSHSGDASEDVTA